MLPPPDPSDVRRTDKLAPIGQARSLRCSFTVQLPPAELAMSSVTCALLLSTLPTSLPASATRSLAPMLVDHAPDALMSTAAAGKLHDESNQKKWQARVIGYVIRVISVRDSSSDVHRQEKGRVPTRPRVARKIRIQR